MLCILQFRVGVGQGDSPDCFSVFAGHLDTFNCVKRRRGGLTGDYWLNRVISHLCLQSSCTCGGHLGTLAPWRSKGVGQQVPCAWANIKRMFLNFSYLTCCQLGALSLCSMNLHCLQLLNFPRLSPLALPCSTLARCSNVSSNSTGISSHLATW